MGGDMIDDEQYEEEILVDNFPLDPVAARCQAFTCLLALTDKISDPDLRKEAMAMLTATRRSFHTLPVGELTAYPGGKQ